MGCGDLIPCEELMKARCSTLLIAIAVGATCLDACSVQYSAAPISAQVVDAKTGLPIAGVNVVAHWQLEGGLEGGTPIGAVTVMEVETDSNGRFQFPAWGPKEVSRPSGVYANARIKNAAPALLLFKSGYHYKGLRNSGSADSNINNMRSQWDGRTIKLEPFRGDSSKYASALWGLSNELAYNIAFANATCLPGTQCPAACQWQNTPKMILAIGQQFKAFERERIREANIYNSLMSDDERYRALGCASPAVILGGQLK